MNLCLFLFTEFVSQYIFKERLYDFCWSSYWWFPSPVFQKLDYTSSHSEDETFLELDFQDPSKTKIGGAEVKQKECDERCVDSW